MEETNKIMDFAVFAYSESQKQIEMHDKWIEFITPVFFKNWGFKYRYELEGLYAQAAKNFINQQREIFNNKHKTKCIIENLTSKKTFKNSTTWKTK